MESKIINQISFKYVSLDDFLISLDRLTRFKHPSEKYFRVFKDILSKYLITPKYSKRQLENLDSEVVSALVKHIWNESVKNFTAVTKNTDNTLKLMNYLDKLCFKSFDPSLKTLMKTKLIVSPLLDLFESQYKKLPKNIQILINYKKSSIIYSNEDIKVILESLRSKNMTKYPISKLVLTEGITEEILLPEFSNKMKYNFDQHGIFVLGAGGKSKIPNLYAKLKGTVKLPVLIVLDNDASEIYDIVSKMLMVKDKIILINKGEFEDIVSKNLIKRSINQYYYDLEPVTMSELSATDSMCENIKNIYKNRKIGEFQKAHFAKVLAQNIKYDKDVSQEIQGIIKELKSI